MIARQNIRVTIRPRLPAAVFGCWLSLLCFGQTHSTLFPPFAIDGVVIDSVSRSALDRVTIFLEEAGGRRLLRNGLSDRYGRFALRNLPPAPYQLVLSFVGYRTKRILLPASSHSLLSLGEIPLVPVIQPLAAVKIVAQKPLVEQTIDKIIYNAEADPERDQLSAFDLLRKVPLLSVDGDDNLEVNGKSNYQVLINGMPSTLFVQRPEDAFKSMPAASIKSVEVITHPASRYGADGSNGVVNIITYQKLPRGYTGSVHAAGSRPSSSSLNLFVNVVTGKLGFSISPGLLETTLPTATNTLLRTDPVQKNSLVQEGKNSGTSHSQLGSAEASYGQGHSDAVVLGVAKNAADSRATFLQGVEFRRASGGLLHAYRSENSSTYRSDGSQVNANWKHRFKKNDSHFLLASFLLGKHQSDGVTDFDLQPLFNYKRQQSNRDNHDAYTNLTLQVDYVHPFKKQSMELGIKSLSRLTSSDYKVPLPLSPVRAPLTDMGLRHHFSYEEQLSVAYASFNLRLGRWGLQAGVRAEYMKADSRPGNPDMVVSQDYLNFLPSMNLLRRFGTGKTATLFYTQRIERPPLSSLNPLVDATDPRNISYGNPLLHPATTHVLEAGFTSFGRQAFVRLLLFHHFTNDAIQPYTILTADTVARTSFGNIGQRKTSGLSVNGNINFLKRFSASLGVTCQRNKFSIVINGRPQRQEGSVFTLNGTLSCRLSRTWRAGNSFGYSSAAVFAQGKASGNYWNHVSVTKTFLKENRAAMTLTIRYLFPAYRTSLTEVFDPGFYQVQQSRVLARQVGLGVSYRFGRITVGRGN